MAIKQLGLASAILLAISGYGTNARADAAPINLTALTPGYQGPSAWVDGQTLPGFTVISSTNNLTIVGNPNLPNYESTHNTIWLPTSGDFTATVTATTSAFAGAGFYADFPGGYAGVGLNNWAGVAGSRYSDYGYGFGNVHTEAYTTSNPDSPVVMQITRSGNVLSAAFSEGGGGFVNALTLYGSNVAAPLGFDLTSYGTPNMNVPVTTTFSNFSIINTAASNQNGMQGGTASNPLGLTSATGSISGQIGGNYPGSSYYTFHWNGGNFQAFVGVPDAGILAAPPSYGFELCDGTQCNPNSLANLIHVVADSSNNWENNISSYLGPGFYTIGIIDQGVSLDPQFNIVFATPVSAPVAPSVPGTNTVPEPGTMTLAALGLATFASIRKRRQ
ncbi:MAG: PEP-CTERM sorting domain-containing protein [Proteobacteria bacterium]|nr:PEP-CTERM sorting domain-containing protein [Pseudomonadota bacterium]